MDRKVKLMNEEEKGLPWYACEGRDLDVITSSRVRLSRNLANFPFPEFFHGDDAFRVQTLVFDSFSQLQSREEDLHFHAVETSTLEKNSRELLEERGALKALPKVLRTEVLPETGLVMTLDGCSSTTVNNRDHVRISGFKSGLSVRECFDLCSRIDRGLQKSLQFAASWDFGFLTACLKDAGSGMKLSARIHIPGTLRTGKLSVITEIASKAKLKLSPAFPLISQGSVAGNFFVLESTSCLNGTELSQIADFEATCVLIAETERKILKEFAENKRTLIRNSVIRAYSIARFSLLISFKEAVDIISDIKTGLNLGLLSGIENSMLCGLLFRVQPAHLSYLLESGDFSFEEDIRADKRAMIDRLRALILQEAFEKISLGNL